MDSLRRVTDAISYVNVNNILIIGLVLETGKR
jgi:hypothetical protein